MKTLLLFALVGAGLYVVWGVDLTPAIPLVLGGLLAVGAVLWIGWTLHYVASGQYQIDRRIEHVTRR